MKIFVLIFTMMMFASCDKGQVRDKVVKQLTDSISKTIASQDVLDCSNIESIKADIKEQLLKVPFLQPENMTNKSLDIKVVLCEKAVGYVIPIVVNSTTPSAWECQASVLTDLVPKVAEKVCSKL